jgi:hypothetical protein
MALRLTQPLTEMSRGIFPDSRSGRYVGLTTLPPSCANCLEIWEPQTLGTIVPVQACNCLLAVNLSNSRILEFGRGIAPILHTGKRKQGWF